MRVLVTGGAGYVGSFVTKRLIEQGHEVRVLDNLSAGSSKAIPEIPLDKTDIRNESGVGRAMRALKPEAVIHLAALKSSAESLRRPDLYYDVNVTGTAVLLAAANRHDVRLFMLSSTCAVYGTPQICPVDEHAPIDPQSPYGETKWAGERMLEWFARESRMRYASLRYFNVAGAASDGSLGEYAQKEPVMLVPRAIGAALRGASIEVYGEDYPTEDGTALRDFVHVDDIAGAHVHVMEQLDVADHSGTYNLGSGEPRSVLEVLNAVERISDRPVQRTIMQRRAGDPAVSWADAALARSTFGWEPALGMDEIIRSAWEWHRARSEGGA